MPPSQVGVKTTRIALLLIVGSAAVALVMAVGAGHL